MRTLIAALGNPLSVEDSFGPKVLEVLRRDLSGATFIDLVDAHTDLLAYIGRFESYSLVILIDALLDSSQAGQVISLEESALISLPEDSASIHQFSPVFAIKLFRQLYPGAATRIFLVALCVPEVTFSSSAALDDDALARAAGHVMRILQGTGLDH